MSAPSPAFGDLSSLVTNIVIGASFLGAIFAGWARGRKETNEIRKSGVAESGSPLANIAAATILDNVTRGEWPRSHKQVHETLLDTNLLLTRVCVAMNRLADEVIEGRNETSKSNGAMGRLKDEIEELRRDLTHRGK